MTLIPKPTGLFSGLGARFLAVAPLPFPPPVLLQPSPQGPLDPKRYWTTAPNQSPVFVLAPRATLPTQAQPSPAPASPPSEVSQWKSEEATCIISTNDSPSINLDIRSSHLTTQQEPRTNIESFTDLDPAAQRGSYSTCDVLCANA